MSVLALAARPGAAATLALGMAVVLLVRERRRDPGTPTLAALVALPVLAFAVGWAQDVGVARPALVTGIVVAALARDARDRFASELGVKLLWLVGAALALSWAGMALLAVFTGTGEPHEQWAVLSLGLESRVSWGAAISLSLLAGMVLLGGAPFHFWIADLQQGGRPWLAALATVALQATGAAWLIERLRGLDTFAAGALATEGLLRVAAIAALLAGAATLLFQRRPERRVGTLASLNGALVLATLAAAPARDFARAGAELLPAWTAHLVLALTGAGLLARFLPASTGAPAATAPLFARHRATALAGIVSLLSLAGVPGTPGGIVWLGVARVVANRGDVAILAALAIAWLAAFAAAVEQAREGFGIPAPPPERGAPRTARVTLWVSAASLALLWAGWALR